MTQRSFTIADIKAAIAAENQRHEEELERLEATLSTFERLANPGRLYAIPMPVPTRKTSPRIVYDPEEYGGKKRLLLRLIAAEEEGLSSADTVAAAQFCGLAEAR